MRRRIRTLNRIDGPEACDSSASTRGWFSSRGGFVRWRQAFRRRGRGNACSRDDIIEIAPGSRRIWSAKFDSGIEHWQRLACAKSAARNVVAISPVASAQLHATRSVRPRTQILQLGHRVRPEWLLPRPRIPPGARLRSMQGAIGAQTGSRNIRRCSTDDGLHRPASAIRPRRMSRPASVSRSRAALGQ